MPDPRLTDDFEKDLARAIAEGDEVRGWATSLRLELLRQSEELKDCQKDRTKLAIRLAVVETKVGTQARNWGIIAGALSGLLCAVISGILIKLFSP